MPAAPRAVMHASRSLPFDLDLLALQRHAPAHYPLLLQSPAQGTAQGRWDLLLMADGTGLRLGRDGITRDAGGQAHAGGFLEVLDAQWRALKLARQASPWPFAGGWALRLGYELAEQVEPVLHLPAHTHSETVAAALRCPAAVLRDRQAGTCTALAETGAEALLARLDADVTALEGAHPLAPWPPPDRFSEEAPARFLQAIIQALDYIAAGDVFQVNLSRGWEAHFDRAPDPSALYARLCRDNPAPFAALLRDGQEAIVSASPERLVCVRGERVETRPIAGTRPRLPGEDDARRIDELVGNPKERAEHVMLIDLERNDLGRLCQPGSVEVDELMAVESYAHVHHIVSNVRGLLREEVTPGQVIAAVFPGGTITGCPKVRCMQIIAELEGGARGAYTGALGWLGRDGDMDLNILIRSAELLPEGEGARLRLRTGAGIVADSEPARELEETRAKARGLLRALGVEAAAAPLRP